MAQRYRTVLALLVCVAVGVMAYEQYLIRLSPTDNMATLVFVVVTLLAAFLLRFEGSWPEVETEPLPEGRRWPGWLGALVVLVGIVAIGFGSYLLTISFQHWIWQGWALIIGGTAVLSLGCYGLDPRGKLNPTWTRGEVVALLAIFALAMFLRFFRYTEFPGPYSMHAIEEPQAGMRAVALLQGVFFWEFLFDNVLAAGGIWLFGDRTINIIRIPFTLVSAVTVFPLYVMLRQIVSKPAALAGTFLWAVSSWNIIYSRCAHGVFPTNLIVIAAFAFLLMSWRTRRLASLPWAALFSAYCLFAYAGYRGTPLVVLMVLGFVFLGDLVRWFRADVGETRLGRYIRRDIAGLALQLGMILAMAVPIYRQVAYNAAQPMYYFEAANRSLSNTDYYNRDPQKLLNQRLTRIRESAKIFMHRGDGSDTFNEPAEPMLDPLTSVAFVGGIALCLLYPRRRFHWWVLFMFLFVMAGGAVFVQNLDVRRLQGVTPFVAALAAIFLDRIFLLSQRLPRPLLRGLGVPVLVVGAGFATWWGYNVYFNKMAKNRFVQQAFHQSRYLSLIHYGRTVATNHYTLLVSDIRHFFHPSDYYWLINGLIEGRDVSDLLDLLPPKELDKTPLPINVAIQNPYERVELARLLKQVYPGTECADFVEEANPFTALTYCTLPRTRTPAPVSMRLTARYYQGKEASGTPVIERQEPFISWGTYPPLCYGVQNPELSCTVEWSGTFHVPKTGAYHFLAATRDRAKVDVKIDGKPLAETMELTAGDHHVTALAVIPRDSDTGVRLEWKTETGSEAVPFYSVGNEANAAGAAATGG